MDFPKKIICLTEESVEILYELGQQDRIVGVSSFVKRPKAAQDKLKVSLFTSSNYKKIAELEPDLILGHSDIQKEIARDLIERGHNVFIANHRSISEILDYTLFIARIVGEEARGRELVSELKARINSAKEFASKMKKKPRVYFEEWDDPMISSIKWVSELIELCGGENIFKDRESGLLAKDRFVQADEVIKLNPNIIFGCWCGKRVRVDQITTRSSWTM